MTEQEKRIEWLKNRKKTIGASESAAVFGVSPYHSPFSLWQEKTSSVVDDRPMTNAQKVGLKMEPIIAEMYAEETGREVTHPGQYTTTRSPTHPFMSATLDRVIKPIDTRGPGVLELKTAHDGKKEEWNNEPPLEYLIQVQHQMFVSGYQWGSIAVLFMNASRDFFWCDVERNEDFIQQLVHKCTQFWKLVTDRVPPEADGHHSTLSAIKKMYPSDTGKTKSLSSSVDGWAKEMSIADEEIKKWQAMKNECMAKIQLELGDATFGVSPSGMKFSFKTITRKSYTVDETSYRQLRKLGGK